MKELTYLMMQQVPHDLLPYFNSQIKHIRHFIKILCVNKWIKFMNLSVYKKINMISSIPTYFENNETPIICYKYNKPILSTVLSLILTNE